MNKKPYTGGVPTPDEANDGKFDIADPSAGTVPPGGMARMLRLISYELENKPIQGSDIQPLEEGHEIQEIISRYKLLMEHTVLRTRALENYHKVNHKKGDVYDVIGERYGWDRMIIYRILKKAGVIVYKRRQK